MKWFAIAAMAAGMLSGSANAASTDAAPPLAAPAPASAPRIMMLRLYVADIARGEQFYHDVFHAFTAQKMGDKVRIMMFPGGATPGIILIQSKDETTMNGSFVIQVPDLAGTLAAAQANGAKLLNTKFEQTMANMPMRSSHFYDPDGNLIEVLQIGGLMPAK